MREVTRNKAADAKKKTTSAPTTLRFHRFANFAFSLQYCGKTDQSFVAAFRGNILAVDLVFPKTNYTCSYGHFLSKNIFWSLEKYKFSSTSESKILSTCRRKSILPAQRKILKVKLLEKKINLKCYPVIEPKNISCRCRNYIISKTQNLKKYKPIVIRMVNSKLPHAFKRISKD